MPFETAASKTEAGGCRSSARNARLNRSAEAEQAPCRGSFGEDGKATLVLSEQVRLGGQQETQQHRLRRYGL